MQEIITCTLCQCVLPTRSLGFKLVYIIHTSMDNNPKPTVLVVVLQVCFSDLRNVIILFHTIAIKLTCSYKTMLLIKIYQ